MIFQWILYDQCNASYIYEDANRYLFLVSSQKPPSPYGPLNLNEISCDLEKKIGENFVQELQQSGCDATFAHVDSWTEALLRMCKDQACKHILVMSPSEWQLQKTIEIVTNSLSEHGIVLECRPNTQFLVSHAVFSAKREKPPVMETFYRWMRKETGILMEGDQPVGGKWNYDKENRKFDRNHSGNVRVGSNTFWL